MLSIRTGKGACPSPIQGFQLAAGQPVHKAEEYEFGALGAKKKGTISITPPGGDALWLTHAKRREMPSSDGAISGTLAGTSGQKTEGAVAPGQDTRVS